MSKVNTKKEPIKSFFNSFLERITGGILLSDLQKDIKSLETMKPNDEYVFAISSYGTRKFNLLPTIKNLNLDIESEKNCIEGSVKCLDFLIQEHKIFTISHIADDGVVGITVDDVIKYKQDLITEYETIRNNYDFNRMKPISFKRLR